MFRVGQTIPSKLKVLFLDEWANNNYTPEQKEALRKSMLERLARGRDTHARGGYQALVRGLETQARGGYQALARGRETQARGGYQALARGRDSCESWLFNGAYSA